MIDTLWVIIVISIIALIIGIVFVYKYLQEVPFKILFMKSSLPLKLLMAVIVIYLLSLPIQIVRLYQTEPHNLNYGSTRYNDVIDVNDGIIAVGYKSKSGPTITKYDYSGNVIWRTSYKESNNSFIDAELTSSGNIAVSIRKDYYDETGHIVLFYNQAGELIDETVIYNVDSLEILDQDCLLAIQYKDYEYIPNLMVFTKFNLKGNEVNSFTYNYGEAPESQYRRDFPINNVGQTNEHLFLTISDIQSKNNDILEERLLIFNQDLTLVNEVKFDLNKQITKIIKLEDAYYILWNNREERKSMLTEHDTSFNLINQYELNRDSSYLELNDMMIHNGHLFLIGNQYVNQDQVGFTDDFRGVRIDFNTQSNEFQIHESKKGVGLNRAFIKNDSIYGVGLLNTHAFFLSNSYMHDNPYMGLLFEINLKDDFDPKILEVLEDDRYR
jgi:uncharacterized integral membrane protein